MKNKQLNVWIPEELRDHIAGRARQEECHMNDIIATLIRDDIARRDGSFIEHTILMALQEIVAAEIRHAHVQLRSTLRNDWQQEVVSCVEHVQRYADRLISLQTITVRMSCLIRRLVYASLSKAYGVSFAKAAYEDAKEKVQEELAPKRLPAEHTLREDDPVYR